uniref:Protein DEHYDRATION-INDUCED 19 homolog 4-like n=1 Tax=Rhizophora mucronata TaxID=61149 RepID=A0A2P2JG08_RHIMU
MSLCKTLFLKHHNSLYNSHKHLLVPIIPRTLTTTTTTTATSGSSSHNLQLSTNPVDENKRSLCFVFQEAVGLSEKPETTDIQKAASENGGSELKEKLWELESEVRGLRRKSKEQEKPKSLHALFSGNVTSRRNEKKSKSIAQQQQQQHQDSLDRLSIYYFEEEGEVRPDFPCPYCYEDFDTASLCAHLEDEHSCESKPTVCPVCSAKIARDMLSHITLQHGHLFKLQRHRRFHRLAVPNSQASSFLGRDLREAHLQMLLGGGGYRSNNANVSNIASDPFLSSLLLNFPSSEAEEISKSVVSSVEEASAKKAAPVHMWKSSLCFDPSLSHEERQKRIRQAAGRAGFVQDLLLSTLLND